MGSSRAAAAIKLEAFAPRWIVLPFPPSALSGHNNGHWRDKAAMIAKHREWACNATRAAKTAIPEAGDILVRVRFYPPDGRGDRINFPNRMKPYFDGIADALKVNDSRFLPAFEFHAPDRVHPRVEVEIEWAKASGSSQRYVQTDSLPIAGLPQ